jgi:hypothetical protein
MNEGQGGRVPRDRPVCDERLTATKKGRRDKPGDPDLRFA